MPNSPVDRSYNLIVTPTLVWQDANNVGASIAYSQGTSTPQMPPIVNPGTGEINLRNLPANANYTNNVLITITLDQSQLRDINGNTLPGGGRWAYDNEGTAPSKGGCFFCAVYQLGAPANTAPIQIPNMRAGRTDTTPGSTVYIYYNPGQVRQGQPITLQFCLGLVLPNFGNYYITIDPQVKGTGTGTSPLDDVEEGDDVEE
jgi:hypothetical protein